MLKNVMKANTFIQGTGFLKFRYDVVSPLCVN